MSVCCSNARSMEHIFIWKVELVNERKQYLNTHVYFTIYSWYFIYRGEYNVSKVDGEKICSWTAATKSICIKLYLYSTYIKVGPKNMESVCNVHACTYLKNSRQKKYLHCRDTLEGQSQSIQAISYILLFRNLSKLYILSKGSSIFNFFHQDLLSISSK